MRRILFVTGTGTGVGKTVLTALLLSFLRQAGEEALAMKPFCSGARDDAHLLHELQKDDLTLEETNPFFFKRPLAPWVEARERNLPQVRLADALRRLRAISRRANILLVEGSGGILVPLGQGYGLGELMTKMGGSCVVAAPNGLGTINHTLLTVRHLQAIGVKHLVVVMMGQKRPDLSSQSNEKAVRELLGGVPVFGLPFLGEKASNMANVQLNAKKLKIMLARVLGGAKVDAVPSNWKGEKQR
jgi:dethiobiotin synthetase